MTHLDMESYRKYREYLERLLRSSEGLKRDDLTKEQRAIAEFGLTRRFEDYADDEGVTNDSP